MSKITIGSWAEYTFAFTNKVSATLNFGRNTYFRRPIRYFSSITTDNFDQTYIGELDNAKAIQSNKVGIRINKALMEKKGAIAPMGHYLGLGIQYFMNSIDYSENPLSSFYIDYINETRVVLDNYYSKEKLKFNTWSIDLFYGARINVTENFFMSWSVSTALSSFRIFIHDIYPPDFDNSPNEVKNDFDDVTPKDIIPISRYQMRINNFFNFRIGIGMILH